MQALLQDFRYSFRQLVKNPGFALTALLSLALGIGATTAVFSVVYAVLMNPYPYKQPERMVHVVIKDNAGHEHWPGLTGPQLRRVRLANSVESATGEDDWNLTTTDQDLPEDVAGVYLTPNSFQHFGVPALVAASSTLTTRLMGMNLSRSLYSAISFGSVTMAATGTSSAITSNLSTKPTRSSAWCPRALPGRC